MITFYKQIREFHKAFGLVLRDRQDIKVLKDIELCKLRYDLIKEEIGELDDAINTKNFIEIIDALSDIMYVVYGCGASFGFDLYNSFLRMIEYIKLSNKLDHYDIVKIAHKKNMYMKVYINVFNNEEDFFQMKLYLKSMVKLLQRLKKTIFLTENLSETENILNKILLNVFLMGIHLEIDLNKSYNIVHSSNMTKLCKDEEEAKITVKWYLDNEKRYDSPSYRKSDNGKDWIVYNKSSGKILKSINYIPANFDCMM